MFYYPVPGHESERTEELDSATLGTILGTGTPVEILLRGHLYVEQTLTAMLIESLPFPELVDLDRFGFYRMMTLASALGTECLGPEDVGAYLTLNHLRNHLAHRLSWAPDAAAEDELWASLSPRQQDLADAGFQDPEAMFPERMRCAIAALAIDLDANRKRLVEQRLHAVEIRQKVKRLRENDRAARRTPGEP